MFSKYGHPSLQAILCNLPLSQLRFQCLSLDRPWNMRHQASSAGPDLNLCCRKWGRRPRALDLEHPGLTLCLILAGFEIVSVVSKDGAAAGWPPCASAFGGRRCLGSRPTTSPTRCCARSSRRPRSCWSCRAWPPSATASPTRPAATASATLYAVSAATRGSARFPEPRPQSASLSVAAPLLQTLLSQPQRSQNQSFTSLEPFTADHESQSHHPSKHEASPPSFNLYGVQQKEITHQEV